MRTTRRPRAPGILLPEQAEFLASFRVHFTRSEEAVALERYLSGLLTEQPNNNCHTTVQPAGPPGGDPPASAQAQPKVIPLKKRRSSPKPAPPPMGGGEGSLEDFIS